MIVAANALGALARAGSAALALTRHATVWELLVLSAALGAGLGLHYPAAQGFLPQTVPPGQLPQANVLDSGSRNAALIGGSALGGALVGLAGPGLPHLIIE